ncbi:photosystem II stability/assembly factor-like protein [Pseudomonas sp. G11-1]|nr:photosystem II stability/assembly factor-like protein [Pseudomonas sp. G11-1]MCO5789275.1 photosystem II stability/assembly factor-like protein [Pseudomonas sp. G11-2]
MASAAELPDTLGRPAITSELAARSMLSAVARAGERLVAVGERGHIILSDDQGASWHQAPSPVSVTLTSVCFADSQHGWAVGHRGVALHTADAGNSWALQLDGQRFAEAAYQRARQEGSELEYSAQMLVEDGPDKPFLDVQCLDPQSVVAVGAYGLGVRSTDGGASWYPLLTLMEGTDQAHVNAVLAIDDTLYMAGEMGGLYRSDAAVSQVERLSQPYEGSYFGLLRDASELFAFGLRGHAFTSADAGQSWRQLSLPTTQSLTAGAVLADGSLLLSDAAGAGWLSRDGGQSFQRVRAERPFPLTELLPLADGSVLGVGSNGVTRFSAAQLD